MSAEAEDILYGDAERDKAAVEAELFIGLQLYRKDRDLLRSVAGYLDQRRIVPGGFGVELIADLEAWSEQSQLEYHPDIVHRLRNAAKTLKQIDPDDVYWPAELNRLADEMIAGKFS